MTVFANGKRFRIDLECPPPQGWKTPVVEVEMATTTSGYRTVIGKVDTGASLTRLTFNQAFLLGIRDPATGAQRTAFSATGEKIPYYVHAVSVRIGAGGGFPRIVFRLPAGFANVKENLFGIDWFYYLCIAVDRQAVHFLSD
jgi:hypothetical protein